MDNPQFRLWLEFERLPSEDDPEDDFFNMGIYLPDGTHYALNVWTYKFLDRLRGHMQDEGENLGGKYAFPPDLFVERRDRAELEQIVADMVRNDQLDPNWLVPEHDLSNGE